MNVSDVLLDGYGRLPDLIRSAVADLSPEQLRWAPAPGANTIGWLVWHLTLCRTTTSRRSSARIRSG